MRKKELTITSIVIGLIAILQCLCIFFKPEVKVKGNFYTRAPKPIEFSFPEIDVNTHTFKSKQLNQQSSKIEEIPRVSLLEELNVELLGVALCSRKDPIAFIKDLTTGKQAIYRLGKKIKEAKIIEIAKGIVVVEKDGQTATLSLSARAQAWVHHKTENVSIYAQAGDHIVVDKRELISQAKDIYQSVRRMKVKPYKEAGKVVGLSVEGISEGSVVEKAGIQNDDIITTVNKQKIDSYQKALQVLQKIKNQKEIKVDFLRDGKLKTLSYRVN